MTLDEFTDWWAGHKKLSLRGAKMNFDEFKDWCARHKKLLIIRSNRGGSGVDDVHLPEHSERGRVFDCAAGIPVHGSVCATD